MGNLFEGFHENVNSSIFPQKAKTLRDPLLSHMTTSHHQSEYSSISVWWCNFCIYMCSGVWWSWGWSNWYCLQLSSVLPWGEEERAVQWVRIRHKSMGFCSLSHRPWCLPILVDPLPHRSYVILHPKRKRGKPQGVSTLSSNWKISKPCLTR